MSFLPPEFPMARFAEQLRGLSHDLDENITALHSGNDSLSWPAKCTKHHPNVSKCVLALTQKGQERGLQYWKHMKTNCFVLMCGGKVSSESVGLGKVPLPNFCSSRMGRVPEEHLLSLRASMASMVQSSHVILKGQFSTRETRMELQCVGHASEWASD